MEHHTCRSAYSQELTTQTLLGALWHPKCRRWLLYVLRQEFRTFRTRIRYALGSQVYDFVNAGPGFEALPDGSFVTCQRTLDRIQDTQQFREVWKRWDVSPIDEELFLRGWTAGERWALQRDRSGTGSQT